MAPYKTAEELGIKQKAYDGLLWTMKLLKKEKLRKKSGKHRFDMYNWFGRACFTSNTNACGTVGCIGGHVAAYMAGARKKADLLRSVTVSAYTRHMMVEPTYVGSADPKYNALRLLFHPQQEKSWDAGPKRAAKKIEEYLTTGRVTNW